MLITTVYEAHEDSYLCTILYIQFLCVVLTSTSEVNFAVLQAWHKLGFGEVIPKYCISSLNNSNFYYFVSPTASKKSKYEDVIDLNICADLSGLRIFIREKKHRIAEIHIEGRNKTLITKVQNFVTVIVYRFCMSCFWGLDSQVIMKKAATDMTAKLKNIIIVDSDETALYKKVGICLYCWFFLMDAKLNFLNSALFSQSCLMYLLLVAFSIWEIDFAPTTSNY